MKQNGRTFQSLMIIVILLLFRSIFCTYGYERRYYRWIPGETDGLDFHVSYCQQTYQSQGNDNSDIGVIDMAFYCSPCTCSESCQVYGTCCPSNGSEWAHTIFEVVDRNVESLTMNRTQDREIIISGDEDFYDFSIFECTRFSDYNVFVVSKCNSSETNSTMKSLCESQPCETVKSCTPVTHAKTGITYRNRYCLQCNDLRRVYDSLMAIREKAENTTQLENDANNGDDQGEVYVDWTLTISCEHYQTLYNVMSEDELLTEARQISKLCTVDIALDVARSVLPEMCDPAYRSPTFENITECQVDDPRLLYYCKHITHPAFRTAWDGKNLFCRLCQGEDIWKTFSSWTTTMASTIVMTRTTEIGSGPPDEDLNPKVAPISFLLGVTNKLGPDVPQKACSNSTWRENEENDCQPALCSSGKRLDVSGLCSSAVDQIRGLGYVVSVTLSPHKYVALTQPLLDAFKELVYARLKHLTAEEIELNILATLYVNSSDPLSLRILKSVSVMSFLISNTSVSRDEVEEKLLDAVQSVWQIDSSVGGVPELTLRPVLVGYELHRLGINSEPLPWDFEKDEVKDDFYKNNHYTTTTFIPTSVESQVEDATRIPSNIEDGLDTHAQMTGYTEEVELMFKSIPKRVRLNQWSLKKEFIDLTSTTTCPYVNVSVEERYPSPSGKPVFLVSFGDRKFNVTYNGDIYLSEDAIDVCVETFKRLIAITREVKESAFEIAQYYFELLCISLSTACLLMSFFTYCLFPSLRSLPGLNNMQLCASLAVAQICLLVAVEHGGRSKIKPIPCVINAVLLHFSWAAAFAWMSICTLHMFRVFRCSTAPSNSSSNTEQKRHRRYAMCVYGLATFVVVMTTGINLISSDGSSYGYNSKTCFLDASSNTIVSFVLAMLVPLGAMIVCNVVLFFLTVLEIFRVTRLQQASQLRERRGLMIYFKLSTITGVFWLASVLAVQLDNPVINLVTSSFAALQGLFIFLSFIVNKRVGLLYKELLQQKQIPKDSAYTGDDSGNKTKGNSDSAKKTEEPAHLYMTSAHGKDSTSGTMETVASD